MLRLFLILFLCVIFSACSSDDSTALDEWFKGQGIASSYGLKQEDIYLSVDTSFTEADTSAYLVSLSAALGKANGIEQMLYFGLETVESLAPIWNLRADSVFYADFYDDKIPEEHKNLKAMFYWLKENKTEHDTVWLKFPKKLTEFDSAEISIDWDGIALPPEFLELKGDTLRLLVGIKLLADDVVLRIAPPTTADIPGLLRVAQKTSISSECKKCLHSGVGESFSVVFNIKPEDKIKIAGKPVVFAELIMPNSNNAKGELGFPVPIYVNSEDYRVDTAYVNMYKRHPNLVFGKGDSLSLELQVTQRLRSYANAANQRDTLGFTLRLGTPMLFPESFYFYNLSDSKVFSDRFAFASYDFSSAFAGPVKLRIWFADFDDKK